MKERPILFSSPMVRAILAGTKTQTRRVIEPQPTDVFGYGVPLPHVDRQRRFGIDARFHGKRAARWLPCRLGAPGDQLWVRETWQMFDPHPDSDGDLFVVGQERMARGRRAPHTGVVSDRPIEWTAVYRADGELEHPTDGPARWRPGIHMPRWASRITLEVTGVRVERLHAITEADAKAEGATPYIYGHGFITEREIAADPGIRTPSMYRAGFEQLWREINGEESWDANPFVWAVAFRRVEAQGRAA